MVTDYNQIVEAYREIRKQAWRPLVEEYSYLKLIGDVSGLKVIDMACGYGFYTRKLKRMGANTVHGFDISEKMIELARWEESQQPLGIEYQVEDVKAGGPEQDYDLATTAWLLVYARTVDELDAMCRGIARRLRPGGRFVTFTTDTDIYFYEKLPYPKYGFTITLMDKEAKPGSIIRWSGTLSNGEPISVDNYYMPKDTYQESLEKAGFTEVTFHMLELSPEAGDPDYWAEFLRYPFGCMISAVKRG